MNFDSRTDYLFSTPDFFVGAGSAINLWGQYFLYNLSDTPEEADALAIRKDWETVGWDFRSAIHGEFRSTLPGAFADKTKKSPAR